MIKINLLADPGEVRSGGAASSGGEEGIGQYKGPIFAAVAIAVLVAYGIWAYTYTQKKVVLKAEIKNLERELDKLKEIIKEKDKFQRQKNELERKIRIIENLKKEQDTPVFLMDQISSRLPEHVWLKNWKTDKKGKKVSLKCGAMTTLAMTNFIENLKRSPLVKDVVFGGSQEKKGYVDFSLDCSVVKLKKNKNEKKGV